MREAFDLFDKDGGETINTEELKCLLRCFDIRLSNTAIKLLIAQHDQDSSGEIEFAEFVVMMSKIIL